jgi:23S rRNA (cytidine1920-2'-O)/16S rRNA (cytidine1409-2'-O)-methyltransferase
MVLAGQVLADKQKVDKPGRLVAEEAPIRILGTMPFVSRAGGKLAAALDHFEIPVSGRVCADLGASTGGFTDCLLQRGALKVHAYDVGSGQLAWKLQTDPRVVVHDRYNVRYLTAGDLPDGISLVTADLSFISLTLVLEPLRDALVPRMGFAPDGQRRADLVFLVKPQFEVGKGEVGKGGIVRDPALRKRALDQVASVAGSTGYSVVGTMASPVPGAEGNEEFLLYARLFPGL